MNPVWMRFTNNSLETIATAAIFAPLSLDPFRESPSEERSRP